MYLRWNLPCNHGTDTQINPEINYPVCEIKLTVMVRVFEPLRLRAKQEKGIEGLVSYSKFRDPGLSAVSGIE